MADERIQLPQSGGGIVRYFEDYESKIMMKPEYVIVLIVIVMLIEIFLHTRFFGLF